jgi:WD40 repeat protein
LGSYVDSHTEDVTQVRFQPGETAGETTSLLVSASEDGLACIFDTNQPSEEAALQGVLNVQTPLRQVGFFGPSYEGVYCLTGSETLSVWHHDTAQRICDFGATLREELTSVIGTPVQYLVDCYWNPSKNNLCLLTGSHTGEGSVFQVDAGRIFPLFNLNNGHKGDIRSWCHIAANRFVTVGEDARLCEWCQLGPGAVSNQVVVSRSGAPVRKEKASKATSRAVSNPY